MIACKHFFLGALVLMTFELASCSHPAATDQAAEQAQDGIRQAATLSQKIEAESRYLESR